MSSHEAIDQLERWDRLCNKFIGKKASLEEEHKKFSVILNEVKKRQQTAVDSLSTQITRIKSALSTISNMNEAKGDLDDLSLNISTEASGFTENLEKYQKSVSISINSQISRCLGRRDLLQALEIKIKDSESMVKGIDEDMSNIVLTTRDIEGKINAGTEEINTIDGLDKKLKNEISQFPDLSDDMKILNNQLEDSKKNQAQRHDSFKELENIYICLSKEVDSGEKENKVLEETLRKHLTSISTIEDTLTGDIRSKYKDIMDARDIYTINTEHISNIVDYVKNISNDLELSLANSKLMDESMKDRLNKQEELKSKLENDILELENSYNSINNRNTVLIDEKKSMISCMDGINAEKDEIEGKLVQIKSEYDDIYMTLEYKRVLEKNSREQVDTYKRDILEYEKNISTVNDELESLNKQMDVYNSYKKDLANLEDKECSEIKELANIENEIISKEQWLNNDINESNILKDNVDTIIDEYNKSKNINNDLLSKMEKLQNESNIMSNDFENEIKVIDNKYKNEIENIINDINKSLYNTKPIDRDEGDIYNTENNNTKNNNTENNNAENEEPENNNTENEEPDTAEGYMYIYENAMTQATPNKSDIAGTSNDENTVYIPSVEDHTKVTDLGASATLPLDKNQVPKKQPMTNLGSKINVKSMTNVDSKINVKSGISAKAGKSTSQSCKSISNRYAKNISVKKPNISKKSIPGPNRIVKSMDGINKNKVERKTAPISKINTGIRSTSKATKRYDSPKYIEPKPKKFTVGTRHISVTTPPSSVSSGSMFSQDTGDPNKAVFKVNGRMPLDIAATRPKGSWNIGSRVGGYNARTFNSKSTNRILDNKRGLLSSVDNRTSDKVPLATKLSLPLQRSSIRRIGSGTPTKRYVPLDSRLEGSGKLIGTGRSLGTPANDESDDLFE